MQLDEVFGAIVYAAVVALFIAAWRLRRRRGRLGPGASGMIHELLNEDRKKAVEIIVEERTGERDPEDRDGNLPDLAGPKAAPR